MIMRGIIRERVRLGWVCDCVRRPWRSNICVFTHILQECPRHRRDAQNQALQKRVSVAPAIASRGGTPDRSKSQYTTSKNHRFTVGANSRTSRTKTPNCLAGAIARCVCGTQMRLHRVVAVQARDRQQIQHHRGESEESPGTPNRPTAPGARGRRTPGSRPAAARPAARLTAGPARLTRVRRVGVMNQVCTYTAAPGRPIPPSAMNTIGSSSDSAGWL